MGTLKLEKGKHFIHAEEKQKEMYVILQGGIDMVTKYDVIHLEAGNIIGLISCVKQVFQCDYISTEDTVLISYNYQNLEDLEEIFQVQPQYAHVFTIGAIKQANILLQNYHKMCRLAEDLYQLSVNLHRDYKYLCSKYSLPEKSVIRVDYLVPLDSEYYISDWHINYYQALSKRNMQSIEKFYGKDHALNIGEIFMASEVMNEAVEKLEEIWEYLQYWQGILLDEEKNDLFQLYFDLEARASRVSTDITEIHQYIDRLLAFIEDSEIYDAEQINSRFTEYMNYDFMALTEEQAAGIELFEEEEKTEKIDAEQIEEKETEDGLHYILEYASYKEEDIEKISRMITSYRELPDMYSIEDSVRKLRKSLTVVFYGAYKAVVKRALEEKTLPPMIKMFLNFGYMDTALLGTENKNALYELTDRLFMCDSEYVFTMYEWLKSIYEGKNEPSRNEFDLDYIAYLSDLRKGGKITPAEQEEWKTNQWKKVEFEIENMFASSNRAVYGRISTFIPMLCGQDIMISPEQMLVTAERLEESMEVVKKIDFSVFYRNVVFSDPEHNITREFLKKEIFPNIILMPNAGSKAMMWQETTGGRRDSSARFLFPILTVNDLDEMMIETVGRFRWEICRKEQGMRWNDIREPSLTSEYYDYVQYYKKNRDLTPEAKEKIKSLLWKAKNNYREVFVKDYQNWIKYESRASFRLNKVSRDILFRYCPFVKNIRETLKGNPMYKEAISKYEILNARKKRHVELFEDKYTKAGGELDENLKKNKEYYEM